MNKYSWKKFIDAYEVKVKEGSLIAVMGYDPINNETFSFVLELRPNNGENTTAEFNPSTQRFESSKDSKKLLIYKSLITDSADFSDNMKQGLVKLLNKIESE